MNKVAVSQLVVILTTRSELASLSHSFCTSAWIHLKLMIIMYKSLLILYFS